MGFKGIICGCEANLPLENCSRCSQTVPIQIVHWLNRRRFEIERGRYHVTAICGCLRRSYYEATCDWHDTLSSAWSKMRGSLFHNVTYAYTWRELSREVTVDCDGEVVKLVGHLDCYDPDTATVMDFKSTYMLEWQLKTRKLPHIHHVKQLQSYLFLFGQTIPIKKLTLYYMDMKIPPIPFEVPLQDMQSWAENRVKILHRSIVQGAPPPKESSYLCDYCQFREVCKSLQP